MIPYSVSIVFSLATPFHTAASPPSPCFSPSLHASPPPCVLLPFEILTACELAFQVLDYLCRSVKVIEIFTLSENTSFYSFLFFSADYFY